MITGLYAGAKRKEVQIQSKLFLSKQEERPKSESPQGSEPVVTTRVSQWKFVVFLLLLENLGTSQESPKGFLPLCPGFW